MRSLTLITTFLFLLSSCSSTPKVPASAPEVQPDVVVERIDALSARPDWLKESEPFKVENGIVTSLGVTSIPSDHRVEAAYRIAENSAKGAISGAIEQKLEFVFQNAEEGTAVDSTQARFIGAEASKITTSSIRSGKRYWEKVATTKDTGERITKYKIFATVTMPEADFKRAVIEAAKKAQGKGGLSADFSEKVDKHWEQFVGAAPK
jgi:hypothetical protein